MLSDVPPGTILVLASRKAKRWLTPEGLKANGHEVQISQELPEGGSYAAIIVTASLKKTPELPASMENLAVGGRLLVCGRDRSIANRLLCLGLTEVEQRRVGRDVLSIATKLQI